MPAINDSPPEAILNPKVRPSVINQTILIPKTKLINLYFIFSFSMNNFFIKKKINEVA